MAASKSTLVFLVLLVILIMGLLVSEDNSERSSEHGCSHGHANALKGAKNRKMIACLKEMKTALNAGLHDAPPATANANNGKNSLRKIPSGPDPLHHNGNNPKKPKTP